MEKLKILIASESYPPDVNGVARFSGQLAQALSNNGHQVAVIAPSTSIKDEIEDNNGLKIFRMASFKVKKIHPYFRGVIPLNLKQKIDKIINDFRPDIIHIQNHFLLGKRCLKIAQKKHIPIVGTEHFMPDNLLEYIPQIARKKAIDLMWKDFVKTYNKLDRVTSPSVAAKNLITSIGIKNDVTVISNGIDLDKFKKKTVTDEDFVKFNLAKNLPIFIFVGRLELDKNVDLILRSTELVLKNKDIQVLIVGKGKDEDKFKKLANSLNLKNKVIFTSAVSDENLKILLSLADVYIGSGSAELQGIAVMEAMAMGLPVLAVNAVALPELVKSGINGFLFELDKNDLAEKMLKIIADKNKLKEMGEQSRILIQKHSQPEIVKKFEELYQDVIIKYWNNKKSPDPI